MSKLLLHLMNSNYLTLFLIPLFILSVSCNQGKENFSIEKSVSAQSEKQTKTEIKANFLDSSIDLCRFKASDFGDKDGDKAIYELINAGFPEDISIVEGVDIFNKIQKCYDPPSSTLTVEEVKAALEKEVCENYQQINDINICYKRKRILEENHFLKGSYLEFGAFNTVKNKPGKNGIWLLMEVDKHRRDLKGELLFPFLIK